MKVLKRTEDTKSSPISEGRTMQAIGFEIKARDGNFFVIGDGSDIGVLDTRTTTALLELTQQTNLLRLEGYPEILSDVAFKGKRTEKGSTLRISINIYGPRIFKHPVGEILSRHKRYLQAPDHLAEGIEYENPHFFTMAEEPSPLPVAMVEHNKHEEFQSKLRGVFESAGEIDNSLGIIQHLDLDNKLSPNTRLLRFDLPLLFASGSRTAILNYTQSSRTRIIFHAKS